MKLLFFLVGGTVFLFLFWRDTDILWTQSMRVWPLFLVHAIFVIANIPQYIILSRKFQVKINLSTEVDMSG